MKGFLAKQKKGKGKAAADTPAATEEAKTTVEDAKVEKTEEKAAETKQATTKNDHDSSEEEEEVRDLTYGQIKETKQTNKAKSSEPNIFEKTDEKSAAPEKAQAKKGPSEIKFGGPPRKFQRGPRGGIGGEFKAGLDDLDGDGSQQKGKREDSPQEPRGSGADGGRQWVNFGSSAAGARRDNAEEDKQQEPRKEAVKPTFRGKANLKGTGSTFKDEEDRGQNRTYDFAVAFRSQGDEKKEKDEDGKEGEREGTATRGGGRGRRGRGGRGGFGPSQAQQDEDEGFEVVRGGRKAKQRQHDDSDSDEAPQTGGGRGGRGRGGRGGFFTNSARTKE